jgi:Fe-S-cluster containining protein
LYGLINTLLLGESIDEEKLKEVTAMVSKSMVEKGDQHQLPVYMNAPDVHGEPADSFPMVNCEERLHICKAICCKLKFALEPDEIEGGIVKWDLGIPYQIRQRKDGYCTHIDTKKTCCSIYDDRPKVCRKFNCAYDERIWKDYEKMELNHSWIAENIQVQNFTFQQK